MGKNMQLINWILYDNNPPYIYLLDTPGNYYGAIWVPPTMITGTKVAFPCVGCMEEI